jgi:UDP-N-acetylmuramyl pentapeptide synthase
VAAAPDAIPGGFVIRVGGREIPVALAIDGAHNVRNALAAAACALAAGIEPDVIAAGLAAFRPVGGRMARVPCASGATLIDDSYNANPDSVRAAIDVLAAAPRPRVLVLGDMGEVGEQGPEFHAEIGGYAREQGLHALLALGELTREAVSAFSDPAGRHFSDSDALIDHPHHRAGPAATLLVKGSRFMKMERVVQALCD